MMLCAVSVLQGNAVVGGVSLELSDIGGCRHEGGADIIAIPMNFGNWGDDVHVGDWAGALCKLSEGNAILSLSPGVMVLFSTMVFTRTMFEVIAFGFTLFVETFGNNLR